MLKRNDKIPEKFNESGRNIKLWDLYDLYKKSLNIARSNK